MACRRYGIVVMPGGPAYGVVLFVGPVSAAPPGKVARRLRLNGRVAGWRLRLTQPTVWCCS